MNIDIEVYNERLERLHRHISNVQGAAKILANKLFKRNENGDRHLAHELICNAHIHDASKFRGVEWEYLHDDVKEKTPELFLVAFKNHIENNSHHPEYWGGIDYMPKVFLAEMICDWWARSSEMGTDLREWIKDVAAKKYNFSLTGKVYKTIKQYIDLLLDPVFK